MADDAGACATSTVSLQHVVWVLRCPFLAEKHMPWTVCWCKFWVGVLFTCKMLSHEYSWKSIFMLLNSSKHSQLTILQSIYMVIRSLYISTKNRVKSCLNSYNNGRFNIKFTHQWSVCVPIFSQIFRFSQKLENLKKFEQLLTKNVLSSCFF
jgi:hypothetical protein